LTTHLKILSKSDIKFFEYPPEFSGEERKRFFSLPNWALEIVENIRIPINKVGFVLQLGYFKSVKRFFISKKFHTRDVDYVTRKLGYSSEQIDLVNYSKSTNGRHQEVIRESLGFRRFDEKSKKLLLEEAFSLCSNQMKPRLIFMSLVEFLPRKKIEIPNYHTFTEAITNALRQFEKNLLSSIQNQLNKEDKTLLNDLLKVSSQYLSIEKKESKIKRYNITILKNFYQSTKPSRIKENIKDFECLKSVFEKVEPILNQLNISPEIVRYYAQLAIKSQVFQLSRRDENRYLLLIAFVTHQFYKLNDVLVDILLQTCQTALNLLYSYKYRSFDNYLIPWETWEIRKKEILEQAGLTGFRDFKNFQLILQKVLQDQYKATNENINSGKNKYARFDGHGNLKVLTPKVDKDPTGSIAELFPKNRFISLFEIMSTVNKFSNFTESFEHWKMKHNREKPDERTIFAGAIGFGCNHGIGKFSKIASHISQNELENTVNWYFSLDNLNDANDKILQLTDRLQLPNVFSRQDEMVHTSSDGKKYNIAVESLNASYSYKYFGKGMGVSTYTFIDNRNLFFYSTVITPSDREAPYVIDGLMHNDVIQSDIHSTDTHGYNEIIFGVTHLLGISFAPRIKNFKKQKIYSFEKRSDLKDLGYQILPDGRIDRKIINEYWDDILRFVATIKLKEATASQLFRRLSSYSRQHPLYRALKQFGRIIMSLFLLRYIDDVELRQEIEKQLNKVETAHRLESAVYFANNQEFHQSTKEEQLIAEGCKRLIENAIICWNYLYLSQLLLKAKTGYEKKKLIHTIKNGSVITWQHINLQGEYDFSSKTLENSYEFQFPEILGLEIA